jgi:NAD+ synthase (glutamine-hydrolysing)
VPIGDLSYRIGDVRMAVEICEEAWGDHTGAAVHARHGAEIVLAPSASHFAFGKYEVRERLVSNNSRAMAVHYIYTNLVGLEAGRAIYDGGVMIAECGKIVARGPRFGFNDYYLTTVDIDLDLARVGKIRGKSVRNEEDEDLVARRGQGIVVRVKAPWSRQEKRARGLEHGRTVGGVKLSEVHHSKESEFLEAEMLALFDYMRKSRAQGYVVSLSGGVDSSTCASLVAHMAASALQELGPGHLAKRLSISDAPKARAEKDPRAWVSCLLTTVYQKTRNSSAATRQAASALSVEIGARHIEADVQPMVDAYCQAAKDLLKVPLNWRDHDIALQNIQARARAPMAWLVANLRRAVLLTTSNRSEGAVGYATMDGDMAGGLAPLAGIDKPFLRQWMGWAASQRERGLGALKSLAAVTRMPPTAELRPGTMKQSDEDDLMPYVILERIERLLVRDKASPADILASLRDEFPSEGASRLEGYLCRFLRLFSANQWKRERMAVGFHLDDESLDPKTWCRFPVLSGGFVREMGEMGARRGRSKRRHPKK